MERRFQAGDIVRHFKREIVVFGPNSDAYAYMYEILGYAQHTENKEELVVYRALYGDKALYARPTAMFESKVDTEKYKGFKQEYRFETMSFEELEEVNHLKEVIAIETLNAAK
jgi:hypothetical protein